MSDAATASNNSTGIYIHIPFCQSKCPYCDFYSVTDLSRIPDYLNALQAEMRMTADSGTRADTLYIGGGTPSVLTPGQMGQIVDWTAAYFNLTPTAEMTLEINPATATTRDLQDYAAFGFNRLNIGVQSFSDRNLSFLGRRHNADQALAAIKAGMDAGFGNIGFDLMFGLPEQTAGAWKNDLLQAIRLAPKHLSCYLLSYEPHTNLHADLQAGRFTPLSDFHSADLFRMAHDFLGAAGYEHYEVSNYARGARWRSNHNQKYWNFAPYIGLGPSAHGCCLPRRWWNHRSLDIYLEAISKGLTPMADEETLSDEQQLIEALYLGLRQFDGIDFIAFQTRFHIDFKLYFHTALDRFSAEGWLEMDNRRCCLSVEGMLFLDRIVDELVEMIN
jgi:putative oxygen-independent coproporphyrinogen III oxidase